jgi:hypothetical protein
LSGWAANVQYAITSQNLPLKRIPLLLG